MAFTVIYNGRGEVEHRVVVMGATNEADAICKLFKDCPTNIKRRIHNVRAVQNTVEVEGV